MYIRFLRSRQAANIGLLHTSACFHSRSRLASVNRQDERVRVSADHVRRLRGVVNHPIVLHRGAFAISQAVGEGINRDHLCNRDHHRYRFMIRGLYSRDVHEDVFRRIKEMEDLRVVMARIVNVSFRIILLRATAGDKGINRPIRVCGRAIRNVTRTSATYLNITSGNNSFHRVALLIGVGIARANSYLSGKGHNILPRVICRPLTTTKSGRVRVTTNVRRHINQVVSYQRRYRRVEERINCVRRNVPSGLRRSAIKRVNVTPPLWCANITKFRAGYGRVRDRVEADFVGGTCRPRERACLNRLRTVKARNLTRCPSQ